MKHSCNSRATWPSKGQILNDPPNKVCPIGSRCFDLYTGSHLELRLLVLMATWSFHPFYRFALLDPRPSSLYLLPSTLYHLPSTLHPLPSTLQRFDPRCRLALDVSTPNADRHWELRLLVPMVQPPIGTSQGEENDGIDVDQERREREWQEAAHGTFV